MKQMTQVAVLGEPVIEESQTSPSSCLRATLLTGLCVFMLIVVAYRLVGFSINRSDVAEYINWSHNLLGFKGFASHLPGYPASLAVGRLVTLGLLGDAVFAQAICLGFWGVGVVLAWLLLRRLAPEIADIGALLIGLFPFVGVSMAAFPYADIPAFSAFLAACLAGTSGWPWTFAALTVGGLLMHQALYPFYLLLALWCWWKRKVSLIHPLACCLPFAAYYVAGELAQNDAFWVLKYHSKTHQDPCLSSLHVVG